MKKMTASVLSVLLVLSFAGCSSQRIPDYGGTPDSGDGQVTVPYAGSPEGYPYWGPYRFTNDISSIRPQKWIEEDNTVVGWDWSLPGNLCVSDKSLLTTTRLWSLYGTLPKAVQADFELNPVCEMWINWKELEPVEGQFKWNELISVIKKLKVLGYNVVFRPLFCAKIFQGTPDKGYVPDWIADYDIKVLEPDTEGSGDGVIPYDPADPKFHELYLKVIKSMGQTEIPSLVKAAYVGYASFTHGDEGIGPEGQDPDDVPHVIERLDAWAEAFKGQTYKVYMGGPSDYGFSKGFGVRRGFVEMYWYTIPDKVIGQYVDEDGYVCVNEDEPVIAQNSFNGEENEEYESRWATGETGFRFGTSTDSFNYRYFMSMLRTLQMRCNAVLLNGHMMPAMLPFISMELGRTIEDTPDVWSLLCETVFAPWNFTGSDLEPPYRRNVSAEEQKNGILVKNLERWLYQRDSPGYETEPAVKIQHGVRMWMNKEGHDYDYVARKGLRIGFFADDRFAPLGRKALKITYLDDIQGAMAVTYSTSSGQATRTVALKGDNLLKTSTVILEDMDLGASGDGYDFVLSSEDEKSEITVSMVRLVDLD